MVDVDCFFAVTNFGKFQNQVRQ